MSCPYLKFFMYQNGGGGSSRMSRTQGGFWHQYPDDDEEYAGDMSVARPNTIPASAEAVKRGVIINGIFASRVGKGLAKGKDDSSTQVIYRLKLVQI
ncbi:hypothetical protein [Pantoea sp. A4]|uniref:hypothetical protein n=1 Tax=Pantoea sp. A4 TaxID=1225184 RepID=UPI000559C8A8|nr:hypothetical protein [Pantoea sp. A4]